MGYKLAKAAAFGLSAGADVAIGSLTNVGQAENVDLNLDSDETNVTIKSSGGWRFPIPTTNSGTVTAEIVFVDGDSQIGILRTSYMDKSTITAAIMSGPLDETGAEGFKFNAVVKSFNKSQPIDGVVRVSITLNITSTPTVETIAS